MGKIDLKSVINKCPDCVSDRSKLRAVLLDVYSKPEYKRDINVILAIYESGILAKIKDKTALTPDEVNSLCLQIRDDYGILTECSINGIVAWSEVRNIKVTAVDIPPEQPTAKVKVELPKTEIPVPGQEDDYELEETPRGWVIKRFQGFEEDTVTIPNIIDGKSIIGIGEAAFKGCVGIRKIIISRGIQFIGDSAFEDCKNLSSAVLPDTLREIGSRAFSWSGIESIVMPDSVTFLGSNSFKYCNKLIKVTLSENITKILDHTFFDCHGLTDIVLPSKLDTIRKYAFSKCSSLKEVHIPVGTTSIGSGAFSGCYLKAIYIPPTVIKIGDYSPKHDWHNTLNVTRDLVIYCSAGSKAMEYARENEIQCSKAQF